MADAASEKSARRVFMNRFRVSEDILDDALHAILTSEN
jgi:hypothetical protein